MSKTEVWDPKIPWASLVSQYQALLKEQKDIDSVIQPQRWAYQEVSKLLEERERGKRDRIERVAEGTMQ